MGTDNHQNYGELGRLFSLGIEFTLTIVIGFGAGMLFDYVWNSQPIGLFLGLALGIIAAFRSLFRISSRSANHRD